LFSVSRWSIGSVQRSCQASHLQLNTFDLAENRVPLEFHEEPKFENTEADCGNRSACSPEVHDSTVSLSGELPSAVDCDSEQHKTSNPAKEVQPARVPVEGCGDSHHGLLYLRRQSKPGTALTSHLAERGGR
jgi:hypothetical protein